MFYAHSLRRVFNPISILYIILQIYVNVYKILILFLQMKSVENFVKITKQNREYALNVEELKFTEATSESCHFFEFELMPNLI